MSKINKILVVMVAIVILLSSISDVKEKPTTEYKIHCRPGGVTQRNEYVLLCYKPVKAKSRLINLQPSD